MRLGAPRKAADGRHERLRADVVTGRKVALTRLSPLHRRDERVDHIEYVDDVDAPLGASGSPSLSAV